MTLMTEAPRRHADPRWITAARIAGLGVYLPDERRSTAETEARLTAENPGVRHDRELLAKLDLAPQAPFSGRQECPPPEPRPAAAPAAARN